MKLIKRLLMVIIFYTINAQAQVYYPNSFTTRNSFLLENNTVCGIYNNDDGFEFNNSYDGDFKLFIVGYSTWKNGGIKVTSPSGNYNTVFLDVGNKENKDIVSLEFMDEPAGLWSFMFINDDFIDNDRDVNLFIYSVQFIEIQDTTNIVDYYDVIVGWDANTENDLMGYSIYWGAESRFDSSAFYGYENYSYLGNIIEYQIDSLLCGTEYFLAATATDTAYNESDFSNEVSFFVQCDSTGSQENDITPPEPPTIWIKIYRKVE